MRVPLIDLPKAVDCTCRTNLDPHDLCNGRYRLNENGVKVQMLPKKGEQVQLIILDGCLCTNEGRKCDALFVYQGKKGKVLISVELKGTDIPSAVEQLALTRKREEYQTIQEAFAEIKPHGHVREKAVLVSYQLIGQRDRVMLTRDHGLPFLPLVTTKGTGRVQDIRGLL